MSAAPDPAELVERLGPHPHTALALDLSDAADVARWWVAALVLSGRGSEAVALAAVRALAGARLWEPTALAAVDPERVEATLAAAGLPDAERAARRLIRASRRLCERHGGLPDALAAQAEDLEQLGGRLAALAPGIGRASVLRFLRPLRSRWSAAAELPLEAAARAAALHLGWLAPGEDEEGAPGALTRRIEALDTAPGLSDLEAALTRLGARSCARQRPERCPLGPACPERRAP